MGSATWPCSACSRIAARHQPLAVGAVAVTAVGKRSLSCYLAQSVICAPALAAWGLGLGETFGSAAAALFAIGVWLVTLMLAYLQERADQRGPAEVLLRRLVYPRSSSRSTPAG